MRGAAALEDKADASGLLYRRNRYYDPGTGRFTQEDPIGLAGGMNLYGFAAGDPVNFSDPFGLCPESMRDADGNCPGGLPVSEWNHVEEAIDRHMQQEAGEYVRSLLYGGKIHGYSGPYNEGGYVDPKEPKEIYINRTVQGYVGGSYGQALILPPFAGSIFASSVHLPRTLLHESRHVWQFAVYGSGIFPARRRWMESNAIAYMRENYVP